MNSKTLPVLLIVCLAAPQTWAKRVACVGDSITYGSGISDRARDSYPAQLEQILQQYDSTWEVDNFGVSGATMLTNGDRPYIRESAYNNALASNPDIVIIKLGTNDSKPHNWVHKDEYVPDYIAMIDAFRALPSSPEVWICKPVPAFYVNFSISPTVIHDDILPMIDQIAAERGTPVFDLYTALLDHGDLFPDGIHPNAEGAGLMAQFIAPFLLGVHTVPDYNNDGVLNLVDFAHLARHWMTEAPAVDIAPAPQTDAMIGFLDLAGLAMYWMQYPSLVTHWLFDETEGAVAADRLGRFDGELQGEPSWRPDAGVVNGALELDGIDDYVLAGAILRPADGPFTVFAWIQGGGPGQVILAQTEQPNVALSWLAIDATTGTLMTAVEDGGRFTTAMVSDAVVTDGQWHRLRLVWDGARRYLYVDGIEVAADTRDLSTLERSSGEFLLGAGETFAPGSFFAGLVDEVRFYNVALKPAAAVDAETADASAAAD